VAGRFEAEVGAGGMATESVHGPHEKWRERSRHSYEPGSAEKGFFYSFNVEVTGLRGFSRRSG
jgi:hypothetical protein